MYIDIVLGIVVIIGFLYGFQKGVIRTVIAIVSLLIGVISALKLSPFTIEVFEKFLPNSPRLAYILGFLATFIIAVVIIQFIGSRIEKLLKLINLNMMNKIAGGSLIAAVFIILYSCVLWFCNEARLISESQKDTSYSYYFLEPIPKGARKQAVALRPVFQDFWNKTVDVFDRVKEKGVEIQTQNTTNTSPSN